MYVTQFPQQPALVKQFFGSAIDPQLTKLTTCIIFRHSILFEVINFIIS